MVNVEEVKVEVETEVLVLVDVDVSVTTEVLSDVLVDVVVRITVAVATDVEVTVIVALLAKQTENKKRTQKQNLIILRYDQPELFTVYLLKRQNGKNKRKK